MNLQFSVLVVLSISIQCRGKILRNNALISKMITHFQQDNNLSLDTLKSDQDAQSDSKDKDVETNPQSSAEKNTDKTKRIRSLMQNVLCKNFPTIPCDVIMQDKAINRLIQSSIQQMLNKKSEITTEFPKISTLTTEVPQHRSTLVIYSDELSNFLEVANTGYFHEHEHEQPEGKPQSEAKEKKGKQKSTWTREPKTPKTKYKSRKTHIEHSPEYVVNGKKKLTKFYSQKRNKYNKNNGYREFPDEKSMSAELLGFGAPLVKKKSERMAYKLEQSDSPVWRIDYMKRGAQAASNMFGMVPGKVIHDGTQSHFMDEDRGLEVRPYYRKDVMKPDMYINNSYVKKVPK